MQKIDSKLFLRQAGLMPQEAMLEVSQKNNHLYIGLPKEIAFQENRVALTPEAVGVLVNNGHEVIIETNAGKQANFKDTDYSEAGAKIVYNAKEVYQEANIIIKITPPTDAEIKLMKPKQILISALQLSIQKPDFINQLIQKKITAIAYDFIKDKTGVFPVIRAMSEIAGSSSISIAAEYLSNTNKGMGILLGGISGVPPAEVVILGAGTVGEFAAKAAIALGASVKIFDNSLYKLRRLQNDLSLPVFTSTIQPTILKKALKNADVVIGTIRPYEGRTPCIVTEEMVSNMKPASVIIDVSIDHGGCFETSRITNHEEPIYKKYEVIHYCVPNIASRVAHTASKALSNIFMPMLVNMGESQSLEKFLLEDEGVRNGVYLYQGILTNKTLSDLFQIPFKDINLIMAAF